MKGKVFNDDDLKERKKLNHDEIEDPSILEDESISEKMVNIGDRIFTKERKRFKIKGFIILALVILTLGLGYSFGVFFFNDHVFPRTTLNGKDISYGEVNNVYGELQPKGLEIVLKDGSKVAVIPKDAGMVEEYSEKPQIVQNKYMWPVEFFKNHEYKAGVVRKVDDEKLKAWLNAQDFVKNATKSVDAEIVQGNEGYKIVPERVGSQINIDETAAKVKAAFLENQPSVTLDKEYILPKVKQGDLTERLNMLNAYYNMEISIDIGNGYIKKISNPISYMNQNTWKANRGRIEAIVQSLNNEVKTVSIIPNTPGTNNGTGETVIKKVFKELDVQKTTDMIVAAMNKGKSAKIVAVYKTTVGN